MSTQGFSPEFTFLIEEPGFQQALAIANELYTYSMRKHANMLAHFLIAKKQLPSFYFIEAAAEINIAPQACRYLKLNTWPISTQRNDTRLKQIVQILMSVYQRVFYFPEYETYPQAMARFKQRVNHLTAKGITHNRVSQHIRVSYKTLKDLLQQNPNDISHRPRHCPWAMLNRLKHAEDEIDTATHYRTSADPAMKTRADQPPTGLPPNPAQLVPHNAPCQNCGASSIHLYDNGTDAWNNIIQTCRICSKDNHSSPIPADCDTDLNDLIERYAPCCSCGGPWHNLTKHGQDDSGFTIYTCMLCTARNRIPPKIKPPTTTLRAISRSANDDNNCSP